MCWSLPRCRGASGVAAGPQISPTESRMLCRAWQEVRRNEGSPGTPSKRGRCSTLGYETGHR
jgi:hypothetical protein